MAVRQVGSSDGVEYREPPAGAGDVGKEQGGHCAAAAPSGFGEHLDGDVDGDDGAGAADVVAHRGQRAAGTAGCVQGCAPDGRGEFGEGSGVDRAVVGEAVLPAGCARAEECTGGSEVGAAHRRGA
ncbi:MAG TPA: hypothetical protein VGJ59_17645 [Jatrophihabitantaceae bacterium]